MFTVGPVKISNAFVTVGAGGFRKLSPMLRLARHHYRLTQFTGYLLLRIIVHYRWLTTQLAVRFEACQGYRRLACSFEV